MLALRMQLTPASNATRTIPAHKPARHAGTIAFRHSDVIVVNTQIVSNADLQPPGLSPAFFLSGSRMRECSIFVDETGETGKDARQSEYFGVSLVFHEQDDAVLPLFDAYQETLANKHLPDIPLHTEPLLNGNGPYRSLPPSERQQLLRSFLLMVRKLPVSYVTFMYEKSDFRNRSTNSFDSPRLRSRLTRDIATYLQNHLLYFQQFDKSKRYYDNGQKLVVCALDDAIHDVISTEAIEARLASQVDYRLAQVADFICTVELTARKYRASHQTQTDIRFFGSEKEFRKNYYRIVSRLQMPEA